MNKKCLSAVLALVFAALALLCACTPPAKGIALDKALEDMQRLYKSSAFVAVGECVHSTPVGTGEQSGEVKVTQVIAGSAANINDTFQCKNAQMKAGERYLLYLNRQTDGDGFVALDGGVFKTRGDEVYIDSGTISLREVKKDIAAANRTISAHAESYYYKNINELSNKAEYIFIGRVCSVPDMRKTSFRSNDGGSVTENELFAAVLDVEVYGSIKGTLNYGERISLVHCPALCQGMLDAATLRSTGIKEDDVQIPEENGIYLFFLSKGPDEKQKYYFGINPVQGTAQLNKDNTIAAGAKNRALSAFRSLNAVVTIIKKAIDS